MIFKTKAKEIKKTVMVNEYTLSEKDIKEAILQYINASSKVSCVNRYSIIQLNIYKSINPLADIILTDEEKHDANGARLTITVTNE